MTEKRYICASVGLEFEILDSWFGYTGDGEPTEREIEEYDYLVIGLAPNQDAAEGICRRLNDQQDEINYLSNFGLHVILDKKNKEIENNMKMTKNEIKMILQNHKEHLLECKRTDELTSYWDGALDCVECLSEKLGVELK